jgi:hypothetical protein
MEIMKGKYGNIEEIQKFEAVKLTWL